MTRASTAACVYTGPGFTIEDILCMAIPKERAYAALWLRAQSLRVACCMEEAMERFGSPALALLVGGGMEAV